MTIPLVDYSRCALPKGCERRIFWATQPDACEAEEFCGVPCSRSGLVLTPVPGVVSPIDGAEGRTIATQNWVTGLVLNILGTDARRDETDCGHRPGRLGGHWSEAFMGGAGAGRGRVGTRLRYRPATGSIEAQVRDAETCASYDLSKLVTYGVARSVECTGKYAGSGWVNILAVIKGPTAEIGRVGFVGSRVANAWVWQV